MERAAEYSLGWYYLIRKIAQKLQKPNACRAVGSAVGDNPVSVLIPCHRVLRTDGGLGGYHWGLERKVKLLEWEKTLNK